ncbi:MAG TPA: GNAT family N-acetyltransferase [Streptosporangiaceae bacterium]|nr:GNAT family N-acetyltransferase [Streptosporangiaceae bacterium]
MHIRSLGYRTDLMIRLLEGSRVEDRGEYLTVRSPHNPSYWWGNFLLLAEPPEPGRAGAWLERFAAEFPEAKHVALGVDVTEISGVGVREFLDAGLRLERSAVLTTNSVLEPPRPNRRATYRELAGDDDWQQAKELRAVLSEGEPAAEPAFLAARIASERALTEAGHGSWFGAFVDGKLVAHLGLITDGSGIARYQNVETHPDWRRKGLAGTLVWRAGRHGLSGTANTLVMAADPDYVAIRVYRSVGFIDAETQIGFERQPA